MNKLDDAFLDDMEIYTKILPYIDRTITSYGKKSLKNKLTNLVYDTNQLLLNQYNLTNIIYNSYNRELIRINLYRIKKIEDDIEWFNNESNELDYFMFKKNYFNISGLLSATNFMKIYSPSIIIIVYLIIYTVLRYNNININLGTYFKSVYDGYRTTISILLFLFVKDIKLISFLTNILASTYVLYQSYNVYNSAESSINHYNRCKQFRGRFKNICRFIKISEQIYKRDIFCINHKLEIKNSLIFMRNIINYNTIDSLGTILLYKKNNKYISYHITKLAEYIGNLDAMISTAYLVIYNNYSIPKIINNDKPFIRAYNIWNPNVKDSVNNNCEIGDKEPNNILLTGANTAGKSTYIRTVMLSVMLAQTIGITNGELYFTPFYKLFTYINIPNIMRERESLFEAEIKRCNEYCNELENLDKNNFIFTVMDEIFTGTNPKEGIAGSYGVCDYIGRFTNSLNIITTHFHDICDLEVEHPDRFKNMKFTVIIDNSNIIRDYKIKKGISTQNIALELLKNKNYNMEISKKAYYKLNKLDA